MKDFTVFSVDLSAHCGWAVLKRYEDGKIELVECGQIDVTVENFDVNKDPNLQSGYPWNIITAAKRMAEKCMETSYPYMADQWVLENTVKGRNRHTQRLLEWYHYALLEEVQRHKGLDGKLVYMDPSQWRKILDLRLSKDQKRSNAKLYRAKKLGKSKKDVGIRGKFTTKHLSVAFCNQHYPNRDWLQKDNNIADAVAMGTAFLRSTV